jgi:Trk K+ transport system NAD-binding subunit
MGHCVIVGAGEVGYHIAERLSKEKWDVVVVDQDQTRLEWVSNSLDVQTLRGHGSSPLVLKEAGIEASDLLIAVTDLDEVNTSHVWLRITMLHLRAKRSQESGMLIIPTM